MLVRDALTAKQFLVTERSLINAAAVEMFSIVASGVKKMTGKSIKRSAETNQSNIQHSWTRIHPCNGLRHLISLEEYFVIPKLKYCRFALDISFSSKQTKNIYPIIILKEGNQVFECL